LFATICRRNLNGRRRVNWRKPYQSQPFPATFARNCPPIGHFDYFRYTTTKEYDARGNVISQVDPLGRKTQMEYDALNRLVG
jgi:YD repeat-containing protein